MDGDRRILVIINPISGSGNKTGIAEKVRSFLTDAGFDVTVKFTERPGHATELARAAVDRNDYAVIACGGDGTVNETASALCGSQTILGIIPSGSGNGLARHLDIPVDTVLSLKNILKANVIEADYATMNGRPFFCTFGLGFDAVVSHKFAAQSRRGMFSYVKSAVTEYLRYKSETYTISANGRILTEKAMIIAVCNASQWGNNAYIAPRASITDGLLDIIIVHEGTPIDSALMGLDLFTGYLDKNTMIQSFRAPSAVIYRSHEGPAHLDGEPIDLGEIINIKCRHHGLKIFAPENFEQFTPILTPARSLWRRLLLAFSFRR